MHTYIVMKIKVINFIISLIVKYKPIKIEGDATAHLGTAQT